MPVPHLLPVTIAGAVAGRVSLVAVYLLYDERIFLAYLLDVRRNAVDEAGSRDVPIYDEQG